MSDRVCPGCGAVPKLSEPKDHPDFCPYCGVKLATRDELPRDIWKDPSVKEALKEGRPASDIAVVRCPKCDQFGYYNEGATFSCRFCALTFLVICEDESEPDGYRTVNADDVVRLDDTLTETTDGYHNQTL